MAYDRDKATYHLTPSGWVRQDDPPHDRVETWLRIMTQASGWSREFVNWMCEWASPDWARDKRDELRTKFPIPDKPGRHDEQRRDVVIGDPL